MEQAHAALQGPYLPVVWVKQDTADMVEESRKEDDTLLVIFGTNTPIGAADIAGLLRDLSNDYKRVTGGRLVLWRYETGSSWIYLRDAIAVAGSMAGAFNDMAIAGQHMRTFVKLLIDGFPNSAKPAPQQSQADKVARSVARIVKVAAENGAAVEMRYLKNEKEGLETLSFTMNNQWARKLHSRPEKPKLNKTSVPPTPTIGNQFNVDDVARRLVARGGASADLVDTMVSALKLSGGGSLLPQLANSLENAGHGEMAKSVRRHF